MTIERDPDRPFTTVMGEDEFKAAIFIAQALRMKHAGGYDHKEDESWVRITHEKLHLLMVCYGKHIEDDYRGDENPAGKPR